LIGLNKEAAATRISSFSFVINVTIIFYLHSIVNFSTKDSLHLNNNQLTILPNEICSCSHALELLDASENNLEAIPTGLYTIVSAKQTNHYMRDQIISTFESKLI
jgi:hypothetical protein